MKPFCFLIDTSFDFDNKLGDDVYILPAEIVETVNGKEKIYRDTIDITRDQIRKKLNKDADLKTSQTPYGVIYSKMEELLKNYQTIYVIVITKEFSGMFNTYNEIAKNLEKRNGKNRILVIDSKSTMIDQNWILDLVRKEAKNGSNFSTIEKKVKSFLTTMCGFTIISNAQQLIKGGRLTGLKSFLVKTLKLKLVIRYQNGALKFIDKSTDMEKAIEKGINDSISELKIPKNEIEKVVILSDLNEVETKKYQAYVKKLLSNYYVGEYTKSLLPSIVITHLGDFSFSVLIKIK